MAQCIIGGCEGEVKVRGLCVRCYSAARLRIKSGITTWDELEEMGLTLPATRGVGVKSSAFGDEMDRRLSIRKLGPEELEQLKEAATAVYDRQNAPAEEEAAEVVATRDAEFVSVAAGLDQPRAKKIRTREFDAMVEAEEEHSWGKNPDAVLDHPDPERLRRSMEDIEAGRTRPMQDVIDELTDAELQAKEDKKSIQYNAQQLEDERNRFAAESARELAARGLGPDHDADGQPNPPVATPQARRTAEEISRHQQAIADGLVKPEADDPQFVVTVTPDQPLAPGPPATLLSEASHGRFGPDAVEGEPPWIQPN